MNFCKTFFLGFSARGMQAVKMGFHRSHCHNRRGPSVLHQRLMEADLVQLTFIIEKSNRVRKTGIWLGDEVLYGERRA